MIEIKSVRQLIDEGRAAAIAGKGLTANPYPANSEHYFLWKAGWHQKDKVVAFTNSLK